MWTIEYDPEAIRELKKIDRIIRRDIFEYMTNRIATAKDPTDFGKALIGDRSGLWRYRVRDYRIICELQNKRLVVLVVRVGHRKDVYQ